MQTKIKLALKVTLLVTLFSNSIATAQNLIDTLKTNNLQEVKVLGTIPVPERLKEVQGVTIFSSKKNEVIRLSGINANLVSNNQRQIFSRVPGVSIWENDGSGIQISIGMRGLNPNRSWEINTRQNGYDISSDVFGYPEAYYNPPMEAVDRIQIVRGAASLQFGPQFGGLVNYIIKKETKNKPFTFETQNAIGSYNMYSTYNAIGGNFKKWSYYVYNHFRKGEGWRENSTYNVRNSHAFLKYQFNPNLSVSAEYTNMDYTIQQSGGLTDIQFEANSQQSSRKRNWFGTPWNLANINFDFKANDKLTMGLKIFGLKGNRNSVGFIAKPNVIDAINPLTNEYTNRQVDTDLYQNIGAEFRAIYTYEFLKTKNNLAFGTRLYNANTTRKQKGIGTTGSDFDLTIASEKYPTEYRFETENVAFFAENILKLNNSISVTPGIRVEKINSSISGRANIVSGNDINVIPQTISRSIVLAGVGLEYKLKTTNFYSNISQAYRPVLFSDLTPSATSDVIDPNLKDAKGYNFDFGYRGNIGRFFNFDTSVFLLQYNNRIGTIRQFTNENPSLGTYQYRTNLGKSANSGFEAYFEFGFLEAITKSVEYGSLNIFGSFAFIKAEYEDFKTTTISGTAPNTIITEGNLRGNKVEYAPNQIHNIGLTYRKNGFSSTIQTRISGDVYSDASNTETPTSDGVAGKIKGYAVYDFSGEYKFLEKYNIKAGINNLTDVDYATRRSGGYPGPGLIPAEGRTFYFSLGAKF